jgi:hypothetical protein
MSGETSKYGTSQMDSIYWPSSVREQLRLVPKALQPPVAQTHAFHRVCGFWRSLFSRFYFATQNTAESRWRLYAAVFHAALMEGVCL